MLQDLIQFYSERIWPTKLNCLQRSNAARLFYPPQPTSVALQADSHAEILRSIQRCLASEPLPITFSGETNSTRLIEALAGEAVKALGEEHRSEHCSISRTKEGSEDFWPLRPLAVVVVDGCPINVLSLALLQLNRPQPRWMQLHWFLLRLREGKVPGPSTVGGRGGSQILYPPATRRISAMGCRADQ